jgi:anthranilate phosphoribosyltransferase
MDGLKPFIAKAASGDSLTPEEARGAFDVMMSGNATPSQIGGFLMALRVRGETVDEIAGAVAVMREKMTRVDAPANAIDIVGTGGDNSGSYNVSTCAAFIAPAPAQRSPSTATGRCRRNPVRPKRWRTRPRSRGLTGNDRPLHQGRRARLHVRANASCRHAPRRPKPRRTRYAHDLQPARAAVQSGRRETAGGRRILPEWVEPIAHVLKALDSEHAWVVHGDGLDELTTTGETLVAELKNGSVSTFTLTPEEVGLPRADMADLKGGDPKHNAAALKDVLKGTRNAYRDVSALNAAAGLVVAGLAGSVHEGLEKAYRSIDEGHAEAVVENVARISQTGEG